MQAQAQTIFYMIYCRKIVGAKFYLKEFDAEFGPLESFDLPFFRSARDSDGHGTHTASTIAGTMVANVSFFGMVKGIAKGGAPSARLAIYKACWFNLCSDEDVHSAMDDAIDDGVDILSLSLGPDPQSVYFEDSISIGSFHAFHRGIFVSASAGNSFFPRTASIVAPWIFTVAASSVKREFNTYIFLGSSKILKVPGFGLKFPKNQFVLYFFISKDLDAWLSGLLFKSTEDGNISRFDSWE